MPSTFWEDLKNTLKGGIEKTEEYTKIGKLKVDILGIKRSMDKTFAEFGREVFPVMDKSKQTSMQINENMKKLMAKIKEHKAAIKTKEKEIEKLKTEGAKPAPEPDKKTQPKPETPNPKPPAVKKSPSKKSEK
jgi:hypothetical protein